jgi:hypothetical protein
MLWHYPGWASFIGDFASFSRVILYDKLGTDLSDPVDAARCLRRRDRCPVNVTVKLKAERRRRSSGTRLRGVGAGIVELSGAVVDVEGATVSPTQPPGGHGIAA